MDPYRPNPSATPAPAAAPIAAPNMGVLAATTPIPGAAPPIQGVMPPVLDGQAPAAAAVPNVTPGAPQASPPVDWEARARQIESERERERAQIQQGIAQLQAQQAEQQERQAYGQRLQMAEAQAAQLAESDPARGIKYMNQFHETERLQADRSIQQRQAQERQNFRQALETIAAPQYADKLARDYNLPPDFAEQLKQVPGPQMDQMAAVFANAARERAQWQTVLQQQNLTNQANQMQASGAYTAGGSHAPGSLPNPPRPSTRKDRDLADWQAMRARRTG